MNVKQLMILTLLITTSILSEEDEEADQGLQIEIPFGNPYKPQLDEIHAELLEVYDVVKGCIIHFLMDVPLASAAEIEANCVGPNFKIVNHIFFLKTKKAMELYNRGLNERFQEAFDTYPDEIAHFMALYKMFLEKGFHNIYETMQLSKHGSRYHVQEDIYDNLLELSKDMLNIIGHFSALLVNEKNQLKDFIKEKLIERDENLKILLRLDKGGVTESEAHEAVVNETRAPPATLAEKIAQMDERVKEETERIESGDVIPEDDIDITGEVESYKYTPFEDTLESIDDMDKAEKELQSEFVPEIIDDDVEVNHSEKKEKDYDEDTYDVKETDEIPEASEPIFKDELDFYYERDNN